MRVQPGQQLLVIVPLDDIWVTANFKESQIRRMRPGQSVKIHVDAFDRDYEGYCRESSGGHGREVQHSAARERDREFREGGAAVTGADTL